MKRLLILPALLAVASIASPGRAQTPDTLDLAGPWKFLKGDNAAWSKTDYGDSLWKDITVPGAWQVLGYADYEGFAWYRRHFAPPEAWKNDAVVTRAGVIGLDLGEISDAYEVFVNGKLVKQGGKFPPTYEPTNQRAVVGIPVGEINFLGDNVIAVRVYDRTSPGGIVSGNPVLRKPTFADFLTVDLVGKGGAVEFTGEQGIAFDIVVSNNGPVDWQAGTVLLTAYDDTGAQLLSAPQNTDVSASKQRRISQGMKDLSPGLYSIRASAQMGGKTLAETRRTFIYNPGGIRGESIKGAEDYKEFKPRLDAFWASTLTSLKNVPLTPTLTPELAKTNDKVKVSKVTFKSLNNQLIHGWLAVPATATATAKVPGLVVLPGFGNNALEPPTFLAEQGFAALLINVHGAPVDATVYPSSMDTYGRGSVNDPASSVACAMTCAGLRGLDFLAQLPEVNPERLGATGVSQGGWLAIDAAALDARVKAVAANSPAADFPRMMETGKDNPMRPLMEMLPVDDRKALMSSLRYFEPTVLAERVKCPVLLTLGLRDTVVPPTTAYALKSSFPRGVAVLMNVSESGGHTVTAEQGAATVAFLKKLLIG